MRRRVTVVVLCMCVYLSVCLSVTTPAAGKKGVSTILVYICVYDSAQVQKLVCICFYTFNMDHLEKNLLWSVL